MKKTNVLIAMALILGILTIAAQQRLPDGNLSTTTTKTLNWVKDGVKIPYTITVHENRLYSHEPIKVENSKTNYDSKNSIALVSKMVIVTSQFDSTLNRFLVIRYQKQVTDTFMVKSTLNGFAIEVDGQEVEFNMGQGIYYVGNKDNDFFLVEEFDMM